MRFTNSNYYRVTDEEHSYYGRVGRLVKETSNVFGDVFLKLDFGYLVEVAEKFLPDQVGEAFQLYELVYYQGKPYRIIQIDTHDAESPYKIAEDYSESSVRLWVGHNSLKRDFPRVKQFLWKEMFWSKSFCLLTTGGAPIDVIKKYIQNQGNNHK